ncbi:hypothetical protein BDN70DRAFT_889916 [Pholiota conissans]|uniref:Uncharacterized protein n=1 Tax=Pholiota conissans TaxID=109636 RepID=A0A9P6CZ27_9AGAR|nr:hypothetical protein BDN70DRAFT_889916 [Pholiota conissans]
MRTSLAFAAITAVFNIVGARTIFQSAYLLWSKELNSREPCSRITVFEGNTNHLQQCTSLSPYAPTTQASLSRTSINSNDVICNGGNGHQCINPYRQPISTTVIPVPGGTQVTAEFHHTLSSAGTNDNAGPIDPSHNGPIIAYLVQIPNAGAYSGADPGIKFNLYAGATSYTIPGFLIQSCSSNPSDSITSTTPTSPTTTTPPPPPPTTATATSSLDGAVAHWGQCGGVTYTAPNTFLQKCVVLSFAPNSLLSSINKPAGQIHKRSPLAFLDNKLPLPQKLGRNFSASLHVPPIGTIWDKPWIF